MLAQFKENDDVAGDIRSKMNEKKRQQEFEVAMIKEATTYLEKVVDRRNPDAKEKALTVRTAVGEAHAALYQGGF